MKLTTLIVIIVTLFVSSQSNASEPSDLSELPKLSDLPLLDVSFGALEFPPSTHIGKNGRFSGIKGEMVRKLCEVGRMNCTFRVYPAKGAYVGFERGRHDALLSSRHQRFESCCTFSSYQTPWTLGIISSRDNQDIPGNEAELIGKNIIVVRGWQSPYLVFPNLDTLAESGQVQITYSDSILSSIKMLQKGRAPLLWGSDVFEWYFNQLPGQDEWQFKKLATISSGIWVSKARPNHDEILRRIDLALKVLQAQGSLENNLLKPALLDAVYEEADLPL